MMTGIEIDHLRLESLKRQDNTQAGMMFTSAEEFCATPKLVYCSKKMNEEARSFAIPRLKYMASVMCIVDHSRNRCT
jgi:hypothetical protein